MTYEEIKTYCLEQDIATQPFLEQIDNAIESYNNNTALINEQFTAVIRGMFAICSNNYLIFENDEQLGIQHNEEIPALGDLWYKWEWITTPQDFYSQFQYEIGLESGEESLATEQPFIESVVEEILGARQEEASRMERFADGLWKSSNGIIGMFEDRGNIVSTPSKKEIAREIYINQGLYKLIQEKGLNVYVPSYIGELC